MIGRRSLLKAMAGGVEGLAALGGSGASRPLVGLAGVLPPPPDPGPSTIAIAAGNSSPADRAAAHVVCGSAGAQATINAALRADNLRLFFFNGDYAIDAPIELPSGCVLEGASVQGVVFWGNAPAGVVRSSDPAARHEFAMLRSLSITAGERGEVGLDLRGFTRSHFDRVNIAGFDLGVWFGGDLPAYESCWTNVLSRFRIENCLTGVRLSGVDTRGISTANQIILSQGEIICRDAPGGKAIDAIDAEFVVELCDIGYGDASAGIVLSPNASRARIVDSRFEWDAQQPDVHPIAIAPGSSNHYFAGNAFTTGCTRPNILDANGAESRSIQLNSFQSDAALPQAAADFSADVRFQRSPEFASGVFVRGDLHSAFAAVAADDRSVFAVSTIIPRLSLLNGADLRLYTDQYETVTMNLDARNGSLSLDGPIVSTGATPGVSPEPAAGTDAAAGVVGSDSCGLLRLTTGASPSAGKVVSLFWSVGKPTATYAVNLTAANAAAVEGMTRVYVDWETATVSGATIVAASALEPNTTYLFTYAVLNFEASDR